MTVCEFIDNEQNSFEKPKLHYFFHQSILQHNSVSDAVFERDKFIKIYLKVLDKRLCLGVMKRGALYSTVS